MSAEPPKVEVPEFSADNEVGLTGASGRQAKIYAALIWLEKMGRWLIDFAVEEHDENWRRWQACEQQLGELRGDLKAVNEWKKTITLIATGIGIVLGGILTWLGTKIGQHFLP